MVFVFLLLWEFLDFGGGEVGGWVGVIINVVSGHHCECSNMHMQMFDPVSIGQGLQASTVLRRPPFVEALTEFGSMSFNRIIFVF